MLTFYDLSDVCHAQVVQGFLTDTPLAIMLR
jgi:hypothetical protein